MARSSFEQLQQKLVGLWPDIGNPSDAPKTMVVVPSLSLELPPSIAPLLPAYEERFLFLLLLLAQPRARVVYLSSQPISERIVDYYLSLLPRAQVTEARERLSMISVADPSLKPLSAKLLERPRTLARIRSLVGDPDRAHLVPFNTTGLEEGLALELGIPIYGAASRAASFGTKGGARRLFFEEGIPHPRGQTVSSRDGLIAAIDRLRDEHGVREVMVKLHEGVGGLGNAVLDLGGGWGGEIAGLLHSMEVEGGSVDSFLSSLEREGGVVEERIVGADLRSPSVQLRITPLGDVELLSTHDQVLGGPTGQAFFGSRFPADPAYASLIAEQAERIAERLAKEGVIGRFAVDFVVVRNGSGGWDSYAIEINLRKGGTTHPFLTLQFLTAGEYDPPSAEFRSPAGPRHYVATDHLEGRDFARLTPDDLLDVVEGEGLTWDPDLAQGIVFHMISALPVAGRIGLTAIGTSPQHADELYEDAVRTLERVAAGI